MSGDLERPPGPATTASRAARSFARLRALRALLGVLALALVACVAWAIWSRESARRPLSEEPPLPASPDKPDKTVQTLERFEFTSTLSGKRDYSISADHLRGIEGGVHTLDGIRSVEIIRPDGKSLTGSAYHGNFKEAPQTAASKTKGRLVLEGRVRIEGPGGDRP